MTTVYTTDARFERHTLETHPEHAGRLHAIDRAVAASDLLERLLIVPARPAERDDLLAVHTGEYVDRLEATRGQPFKMFDLDTYVTPYSWDVAQLAAGAVLAVIDAVLDGMAENGLAAIRPPGHHTTPTRAMGFCLLNNVAIAARYAQRRNGLGRVAIVDYDVHHGNGTQDTFYEDSSVLYLSVHQSPLYPGTGLASQTGAAAGVGATVNIPLPPGVGDDGFRAVFEGVIEPAVRRFGPDLLLISAGFDAHWADPLAQMALSLTGYDAITRRLVALASELCQGRLVVVLEGGYDLQALAIGWCNTIRALLGDALCVDPLGSSHVPEPEIRPLIEYMRAIHNLP